MLHRRCLQLLPLGPSASEWLPVVACCDCCVRIMGLDGKPLFEVATGSPPTAVRYEGCTDSAKRTSMYDNHTWQACFVGEAARRPFTILDGMHNF
jgi:hypothetical protein